MEFFNCLSFYHKNTFSFVKIQGHKYPHSALENHQFGWIAWELALVTTLDDFTGLSGQRDVFLSWSQIISDIFLETWSPGA